MSIWPRTHCDAWHCINKWAVKDNERLKEIVRLTSLALIETRTERDSLQRDLAALRAELAEAIKERDNAEKRLAAFAIRPPGKSIAAMVEQLRAELAAVTERAERAEAALANGERREGETNSQYVCRIFVEAEDRARPIMATMTTGEHVESLRLHFATPDPDASAASTARAERAERELERVRGTR